MIQRQHIFDDILGGSSGMFHSAILTCFSFDPLFYANFYRSNLNSRGIRNQLVLIDSGRLDEVKENESYSYIAGVSPYEGYTPLRIQCSSKGVFHPKIGMFIGEKRIILGVGSGNLTYSGMAYNDEAWGAFCASSDDCPEAKLISDAWKYLRSLISEQQLATADMQIAWMFDNSPLLRSILEKNDWDNNDDTDESFEFAANSKGSSIMDKIVTAVNGKEVSTITLCAPFYDENGSAILGLIEKLNPKRVDCFIEESTGALPYKLNLDQCPFVHFYTYGDEKHRYIHAKLIQIETNDDTILAVGSANASIQALGTDGTYSNDEADVIIRKRGTHNYIKELGITKSCELGSLISHKPVSGKDSMGKLHRETSILASEVLNDGLHLRLKSKVIDADIIVIDSYKQEYLFHQDIIDESFSLALPEDLLYPRTIYLSRNGEIISNKAVVILKSEIDRKNPDKEHASIARLLDNAVDSRDFEELLQYVHIEEETNIKHAAVSKIAGSAKTNQESSKVITDQDFEERVYRKMISFEQTNERILEKIASAMFHSDTQRDFSERPEDSDLSSDSIDSGENATNTSEDRTDKLSVMDEARGFFKRLLKHYDSICDMFDQNDNPEGDPKKGVGIISTRPSHIHTPTNLDYSSVCIAVFEMCKVVRNWGQKGCNELFDYYSSILGRFLMIFRDDVGSEDTASNARLKKKHQNIFVYSMLLACFYDNKGASSIYMKLLVLNMLDSYRNDLDALNEAVCEFRAKLSQNLFPVKDSGVALVHSCIDEYISFIKNKGQYKGSIHAYYDWAILYKQSFGFVYVDDISNRKPTSQNPFALKLNAYSPGFKNMEMHNISHGESAIIFNKK